MLLRDATSDLERVSKLVQEVEESSAAVGAVCPQESLRTTRLMLCRRLSGVHRAPEGTVKAAKSWPPHEMASRYRLAMVPPFRCGEEEAFGITMLPVILLLDVPRFLLGSEVSRLLFGMSSCCCTGWTLTGRSLPSIQHLDRKSFLPPIALLPQEWCANVELGGVS